MKFKAKIYTKKTKADIAVAGSWKDMDTEAFKKMLYENRHSTPITDGMRSFQEWRKSLQKNPEYKTIYKEESLKAKRN